MEKRLLGNKSRSITWEALPFIEYPRARILPGSPEAWALVTPGKELPPNKFEAADKRFVEAKLKDRTFAGTVRIARKEPER